MVMNSRYIAHIRSTDGAIQTLSDHLHEVSDLASEFARKVKAADAGKVLGLLHDFGKISAAFQNYLGSAEGLIKPDEDEYVEASKQANFSICIGKFRVNLLNYFIMRNSNVPFNMIKFVFNCASDIYPDRICEY